MGLDSCFPNALDSTEQLVYIPRPDSLNYTNPSRWRSETTFFKLLQTNKQYPDPVVALYIDTEKSLQYSEELGWNWHKSWNLPNISVRLEIKDAQNGDLLLSPKNIFAQLFAVKAVLENPQSFYLVDVGLRGQSKLELQDGQAFFQALRFASTSYNNEGVKFHLLLCLYIQNSQNEAPKILNSTISPPIFVDSRKSSRNINEKKILLCAEPFAFEHLEREFVKRENKRKTDHDAKIDNDFDGLLNYLTAPNIRHKVKHPIFLSIRFSKPVRLYYNKNQMPDLNVPQVLERLQGVLVKDIATKYGMTSNTQVGNEEKQFIIQIEESSDSYKNKKIAESLDYLNCHSIEIMRKAENVPQNFEIAGSAEEICQHYKQVFEQLVVQFKQLILRYVKSEGIGSPSSDDSQDESDSEPQSQKKVKLNDNDNGAKEPLKNEVQQLEKEQNVQKEQIAQVASLTSNSDNKAQQVHQRVEFLSKYPQAQQQVQAKQVQVTQQQGQPSQGIQGKEQQHQQQLAQESIESLLHQQQQRLQQQQQQQHQQQQSQQQSSQQQQLPLMMGNHQLNDLYMQQMMMHYMNQMYGMQACQKDPLAFQSMMNQMALQGNPFMMNPLMFMPLGQQNPAGYQMPQMRLPMDLQMYQLQKMQDASLSDINQQIQNQPQMQGASPWNIQHNQMIFQQQQQSSQNQQQDRRGKKQNQSGVRDVKEENN